VELKCDKRKISSWCNNVDVKKVQLKSAVNVYKGDIVLMCAECRKVNNGGFKIVR
jgi:hypothetical protein